jgi:hypothetical protein
MQAQLGAQMLAGVPPGVAPQGMLGPGALGVPGGALPGMLPFNAMASLACSPGLAQAPVGGGDAGVQVLADPHLCPVLTCRIWHRDPMLGQILGCVPTHIYACVNVLPGHSLFR